MQKPLNLDALRSFVVFSETLNFTHAAEALHISQPALHVKVQDLSEALGVPLYRKIGRRLELTEQGKNVARFGREIDQRTESFAHYLRTGSFEQSVTLAAGEGAYLYLLGETVSDFARKTKFPLKLMTSNREGVVDLIQSGKAHVGVASLESIPDGFDATLLCKVGDAG
jgi:LysR family transcriptional regulator, low CO2-responsive transcriptional regulator